MGDMFKTIKNAFKVEDLRKKILFTVLVVLVYRLGTAVPVPGISAARFTAMIDRFGQLGQFMNLISGGAFASVSIFSLGIQPYINASIIMQLLTVAIPALERLSKEGEEGRKKITRITRFVTVGLGLVMSIAYWSATSDASSTALPMWLNAFVVIFTFTAGTAFVMWLGELINEKGIGNGISMIIFVGIISSLPQMIINLYAWFQNWRFTSNIALALLGVALVVFVFLVIITLVVFVQTAERRIPIQYAKKVVGRKIYGGQSTYLPIKVNQGGVLPVIFAVSILMLPSTVVSLFGWSGPVAQWFLNFNANPLYYVIYAFLIFAFTFFYAMISFNPIDISNNLQKNGGYIPGIRPGKPTSDFIGKTSRRLNWFDALFLVVIVLMPSLLGLLSGAEGIWFGGTSVLILVGVALDIVNQLEAQLMMRHYKGFLD
ncbi:MAG TPA: preprotein translocase subunit SecY [Clostridiaceae bacterium]|nr:preprotein translocase subunit SecY [Clostridiaceae bacterium]